MMLIEKDKLSKGLAYPLRSSQLVQALAEAEISWDSHLIFSRTQPFFDLLYWPPQSNIPYERLYIRVGAVSASQAWVAREWMQNTVIPEAINWVLIRVSASPQSELRRASSRFVKDYCLLPEA